jgi:hypothetical protein
MRPRSVPALCAVFLWAALLILGARPAWADNDEIVVGSACSTTNDSVGYATIFTCSGGAWARSAYTFGDSSTTCDASHAGLTRYRSGALQLCNGSGWNDLAASGAITNFASGTVGSPGLYVTGDSNTGFWASAADTLNIAAGGVEAFRFNTTASAVNYLAATPATTGNAPVLSAAGSNTNIDLKLTPKGTGSVVNTGVFKAADGSGANLAYGFSSATNIGMFVAGGGRLAFYVGSTAFEARSTGIMMPIGNSLINQDSNTLLGFGYVASAVNAFTITPAASGSAPIFAATGTDANINLNLTPKGTGKINISSGSLQLAGSNGLWQDTTNTNTAVGATSLPMTVSGTQNTAVGYQALNANTTGYGNTAVGSRALSSLTTADRTTAVGTNALQNLTTGVWNTALGDETLRFTTTGTNNTAAGTLALFSNTTGSYNTALGSNALYSTTTGARNTAMGYAALTAVTTGISNTALGYNTGATLTTGSGNILIGNAADVPAASSSNRLNIGNTIYGDLAAGNVGIGQSSPAATLDVNGYAKLKTNSSQPVACSATYKGSIAYTGGTTNYLCFCDGTSWKQAHSPATACTW